MKKSTVIQQIRAAFAKTEYPGDAFLQGSREGCEPYEEVSPFIGRRDWQALDAALLDAHYAALSFFSEGGFRFFLPAYLIADVEEKLATAEPLFHLTGGFYDATVEIPTPTRKFVRKIGASALVNPRRYGAMTFADLARYRLSVFSREEAKAIVAYLVYKRAADSYGLHQAEIEAALNSFWLDRAEHALEAESLARHLTEESEFLDQVNSATSMI
jgi:hypothetical protein